MRRHIRPVRFTSWMFRWATLWPTARLHGLFDASPGGLMVGIARVARHATERLFIEFDSGKVFSVRADGIPEDYRFNR